MIQDAHSLYPQPGPPVPGEDPAGPTETTGYRLNHTMASDLWLFTASSTRKLTRFTIAPNCRSREDGAVLSGCAGIPPSHDTQQWTLLVSDISSAHNDRCLWTTCALPCYTGSTTWLIIKRKVPVRKYLTTCNSAMDYLNW
jgi:hypothetical protein